MACSISAVLIRMSTTDPLVLSALRLSISFVFLSPVLLREIRKHGVAFTKEHLRRTHLPAVVLALHLILWSIGARMTAVAQASLIVNLVPIAVPFFLYALSGERLNMPEVLGTLLAVFGLVVLSVRDALAGGGSAAGNAVCFAAMLLFAFYLGLGRKNRDFPSVWLYVIPVYGQAALICAVVALPRFHTFAVSSAREWALMVGLAVIPTVIGHSLLNAAMRRIRGQIVSLCNVGQFIFAGVLGFVVFHEIPHAIFFATSAVVVAGVAIVVFATPQLPKAPV
jgi:drug/metabolite transporter (DMT)-like permease